MLEMFDFVVVQVRYIQAATVQIPSYRPDGLASADITALLATAAPVRAAYIAESTALNGLRATRRVGAEQVHDLNVAFAAQARSRYRKDKNTSDRLERLPTDDRTFAEIFTRADAIAALWAVLPQLGTPPAPLVSFTIGQGANNLTLTDFTTLRDSVKTADANLPAADQAFQRTEANLHGKMDELEDFVTAALAEGRSRYAEGTPDREIIDAIPTVSPANAPEKAVISSATLTGPGTVRFVFTAPSATSFDILHRLAGVGDYVLIGDDVIGKTFDATALEAGKTHEFIVRPRNSRGTGPDSNPVTVAV